MGDTSWLDDAPEARPVAKGPTIRKGGAPAKRRTRDTSWLDEAPEVRPSFTAGPRDDPSEGMSGGDLRLAGIGRGMVNVGMNVGDIVGRIPGLGGLRPSPEAWEEFNQASGTLMGAERPTGARVPVSFLTGDPETDAKIKANIEAQFGTGRPGSEGSALGETVAVAPVAGAAGRLAAPVLGRVLPTAFQLPANMGIQGATAGGVLGGPDNRGEGALIGGGTGLVLGSGLQMAGAGGVPVPSQAGPNQALAGLAERAAVRATGADRTATRRAFQGDDAAAHRVGRFLLEEGPLRSPAAIRENALSLQERIGPEIGALAQAADKSGATVDLAAAIATARASPAVARLNRNTVTRSAFRQVTDMLDEQFQVHGGRVRPSVAHDLRMQLDEISRWDQTAPRPVVAAWREARRAVDAALDDAMQNAGLGEQWSRANARFALSRTVANPQQRGLSDIGAERRAGNNLISPSETAAGLMGGGLALASHPSGLAIPAATAAARRFGMPTAARTLDWASRLGTQPRMSVDPGASGTLAALLAGPMSYLSDGEPSADALAEALRRAIEARNK